MKAYIKLETGAYPLFEGDIRLEHPEITEDQTYPNFPCPPTYAMVEPLPLPEYDPETQTLVSGVPEIVDGKWVVQFTVRALTQEDFDNIQAQKDRLAQTAVES